MQYLSLVYLQGQLNKINDLGVFAITATSSIFAYIWLYICLEIWSSGIISLAEALITFSFFIVLIVCAFIADKIRQRKDKNRRNKLAQFNIEDFYLILNAKKARNGEGEDEALDSADGMNANHQELQKYLKQVFTKDKIEDIKPEEIEEVLKPKSVVNERIQYRKNIGSLISGRQKVTVVKGEKNVEELKTAQDEFQKHELNPKVGFR